MSSLHSSSAVVSSSSGSDRRRHGLKEEEEEEEGEVEVVVEEGEEEEDEDEEQKGNNQQQQVNPSKDGGADIQAPQASVLQSSPLLWSLLIPLLPPPLLHVYAATCRSAAAAARSDYIW